MKRNLEVREGQFGVEVLPGIYALVSISVTTKKIKNHQVVDAHL